MNTFKSSKRDTLVVISFYSLVLAGVSFIATQQASAESRAERTAEEEDYVRAQEAKRSECSSARERLSDARESADDACIEGFGVSNLDDCAEVLASCKESTGRLRDLAKTLNSNPQGSSKLYKKAQKYIDACPTLANEVEDPIFGDQATNLKDDIAMLRESLQSAQDSAAVAEQSYKAAVEAAKGEVEGEDEVQRELMKAMRDDKAASDEHLQKNIAEFERNRSALLDDLKSATNGLDEAEVEYFDTLRTLEDTCHAQAEEAVSKYVQKIQAALASGTYIKSGGLNRGTQNALYGGGVEQRINNWGETEFRRCLSRRAKEKEGVERKRLVKREAIQRQINLLNDQLQKAEWMKLQGDAAEVKRAAYAQQDYQTQFARSQQKMAEKAMKLNQLQGFSQMGNGMLGMPMNGMANHMNIPLEVRQLMEAKGRANEIQNNLMQTQMQNSVLMTRMGALNKKPTARRSTSSKKANLTAISKALTSYNRADSVLSNLNCDSANSSVRVPSSRPTSQ